MRTMVLKFLKRLLLWWVPMAIPTAVFLGALSFGGQSIDWSRGITYVILSGSLAFGLLWALPLALLASIAHTAVLFRNQLTVGGMSTNSRSSGPPSAAADQAR